MLSLIEKGLSREKAYDLVQPQAMKAFEVNGDFRSFIEQEPQITSLLSEEDIDHCFDPSYQVRNVDEIFRRVGLLG